MEIVNLILKVIIVDLVYAQVQIHPSTLMTIVVNIRINV